MELEFQNTADVCIIFKLCLENLNSGPSLPFSVV